MSWAAEERRGNETPPQPVDAYVAIGSNVGDRAAHVEHAWRALAVLPGTSVGLRSRVLETEPVGPVGQGRYLNAVAQLRTGLAPRALLECLLAIERARGRDRTKEVPQGPRTLDLDLLLYADWSVREEGLEIPHPRMALRAFVMEPLQEIAPTIAEFVRRNAVH